MMGYVLLWIENLTVMLLLIATLTALFGRWRWRLLRLAILLGVSLTIFAAYFGLACLALAAAIERTTAYALMLLTACFAIGTGWILVAGLRIEAEGSKDARGARWPVGNLSIGLAVTAALHLMTVWNLDLAIRQRLATLKVEAGALAMTVAPPRLPDRDNAAVDYQQAFIAMGDPTSWPADYNDRWSGWLASDSAGFDPKDAELRAFLKKQTGALALLREAANKPGCYFDRDYSRPSIDMTLPELQLIRNACRLLSLDARCKAADGDVKSALADCRSLLIASENVSTEPILISLLVAIAIDSVTMSTLEAVLASAPIPADVLQSADLNRAFSYQRAHQRSLRMEEAFGQATFSDLATGSVPFSALGSEGAGPTLPEFVVAPLYRLFLMVDDLDSYRRLMKRYQRAADQPFAKFQSEADEVEKSIKSQTGVLTRQIFPALHQVAKAAARADAQRGLMRLAVAAYRYHSLHGSLPAKLDDLAPDLIAVLPIDPFDGKPLRMKTTERGILLYSIGPDFADNGGAPFQSENKTGDITFHVAPKK